MRTALCLLVLAAAGCGSNLHPVKGRVHFADGSPLDTGRVVVDFGEAQSGAWGSIHPDGSFVIGTNSPSDGMLAGTYRVYISGAETLPGPGAPTRPLVHERFTKPETSGLSFTVPDQTTWDIVVEKPAKVK
jgi:hypothetical protein